MFSLLQKTWNAFARRYRHTPTERWIASRFHEKNQVRGDKSAPLVVVEGVEDPFFFGLQGAMVLGVREIRNIRVARWTSHSLNAGACRSLQEFIAARLYTRIVSRLKWEKLYATFCDVKGDRADRWRAPWRELFWLTGAWRLFRSLKSKEQLAALTVRGVLIGDLVIDSYLRFKPTAEVDLRDWYLLGVLRQAIKDVDGAYAFFRKVKPSLYLTTYATYIQHGIPARVAVALRITTWAFANAQQFGTLLAPDHLVHTKPSGGYQMEFASMPDSDEKMAIAAKLLGGRTSGVADSATANQRSAYEIKIQDVPDVGGAAVVFLHDFFDSAHIYRWMVFHDFWEWACATIEILQEAGLPFFFKPHPNQRDESSRELDRLRQKYPNLRVLSSDVSNKQLVDAGMACAITVYGSVAAEMAYLGVPSIACGDNPHASFDAFHLARDKAEYRALLRDFQNLPRNPQKMRAQASAFYYMHYLNIRPEEQELRDKLIAFYLRLLDVEAQRTVFVPADLDCAFAELENSAGFRRFVADLADALPERAPAF